MTDAQGEYVEALAAYLAAEERLIEAKRHCDPKTTPEAIEKRQAKQAEYRQRRIAENKAWLASPEYQAREERFRRMADEYNRRWLLSQQPVG